MTDRRPFIQRCAVMLACAPLIWLACPVVLDGQLADPATSVTVRIRQQLWHHDIAGVFALPREGVPFEMIGGPNAGYTVAASGGHVSMVTEQPMGLAGASRTRLLPDHGKQLGRAARSHSERLRHGSRRQGGARAVEWLCDRTIPASVCAERRAVCAPRRFR